MNPWPSRALHGPDMFWDAALTAWQVGHPVEIKQQLIAADRFLNPDAPRHRVASERVAELRHYNQHREATILIAETMGDQWLLERARSIKYVHDRYGYIPAHHAERCAEVDREAQAHLDDPLFNVLGN